MKRYDLRQLRAAHLRTESWAIYEPTLQALLELAAGSTALAARQINGRLGLGRPPSAEMESAAQMVGGLAVLPIFGILQQRASWLTRALGWTATETLERDFQAALASVSVKGILLYCDSPGGVAAGVDEVAATIFAGRQVKPVQAFVRGYCASACYYLASAAAKLTATSSSTVGSIGTIYTHVEYSELLKELGIGVTILKHGARKGDGNPYEKLTPESRASLQRWVDAFGDQFDQAVARHRALSVADVRGRYGQGEAFLAGEARARGLIDAVGTWEQLLASFKTPAAPLPTPRTLGERVAVRAAQPASTCAVSLGDGTLAGGWPSSLAACYATPLELAPVSSPASGSPAAASAAPPSPPAATEPAAATETTTVKVSARVRAALFARGFIGAQDVDDAVCLAALGAYFAARGESCPQASGQLDDDQVVAALFRSGTPGAAGTQAAAGAPAPANVQQAHQQEMLEARREAEANTLARVKEIQASGKLLGMTQEQIDAAIQSGRPYAEIAAEWTREVAQREKPLRQGGSAQTVADGHERFVADACLALQVRLDRVPPSQQAQVNDGVRQLATAPLLYFARQCLAAAGVRVPEFASPEEVFELAFAMEGANNRITVGANYSPYNRPGSFPNLMSSLANKLLDAALELSAPTYQEWTGMWPGDLPDFKPAPLVNKSQHDELDEILDSEASKECGLTEEMLSYMVLRRYSNKFGLTPVMAANDDLGAFDEGLLGLESAWQNTVNRLCLRLLTGNVTLLDGFALYDDANHGNDLTGTGSGPPSVTSWDVMQQKVSAQRGVGGTGYVRTPLAIALVPPKQWVPAVQTFASLQTLGELKQAATDANINVFRGTATVVKEPELQAASNDVWYGFARPRGLFNATILRAYFRGWGRNGRRQRWYDPDTKTWYFELEGRVGAAAKQYRLTVRNDGVA